MSLEPPDSGNLRRALRRLGLAPWDADDVAQDALEVWCRTDQANLHNPAAWARGLLVKLAALFHRCRRSEVLTSFEDDSDLHSNAPDPEQSAIMADDLRLLRSWIAQIHSSRRALFVHHAVLGMSVADLSERHGIPYESVKSRLVIARKELMAARDRWRAEQAWRNHGRAMLPFVFPFMGSRPLLARVLGALRVTCAKRAAFVGLAGSVGLLIVIVLRAPEPSGAALAHIPAPPPVRATTAEEAQPVTEAASAHPSDPEPAPSPARAALAPVAGVPDESRPHEASLIGQARAALRVNRRALAAQLLADHARQYRRGRLAKEREALMEELRHCASGAAGAVIRP